MDPGPHATAAAGFSAGLDSGELQLLIQSVARGEQAALAELYDRASRRVFVLALRILKDRQLAEEVVLDVFLQVWRTARSYQVARARPLGWLFTITRSRALDALRARMVRLRHEAELAPELDEAEPAPTASECLDLQDRRGHVRRALSELPADQGSAVHLAYFEGLSHTEIAERTGASLGTVKTRLRLGMQKLRDKLTRFEDER